MTTKSRSLLTLRVAQRVLTIRRQIVSELADLRNRSVSQHAQASAAIMRCRREMLQDRHAMLESALCMQRLLPSDTTDDIGTEAERGERTLQKLRAQAAVRAELSTQLHAEASQAALDRAAFIAQVREELPEELQDEAIDDYDRLMHDQRQGGGS